MTSIQPALLCHYRYDPLDRLINQAQPDMPGHQRFYCKSRLATEIQGVMQYSIIQHDDLLLAQQQQQDGAFDATLLATDLQRSVLSTLKANQERKPITYTPYGHRSASNGLLSLLGFNGERPDPVTGHYLLGNGYRAFNPALMRFNSPDSLSPFGKGGLNSYAYCLGDPINMEDTDGHHPFEFLARALSKTAQKLKNQFKSKYTSAGKVYMPAPSAENMGPFFKLEGMPHLQDMIMRELPGKDLIAFSQVSKNTSRMVHNAKRSPRSILGSVVDLKDVDAKTNETLRKPVDSIISGEVNGVLPGDFAKTELGNATRSETYTIDGVGFRLTSFRSGQTFYGWATRQT